MESKPKTILELKLNKFINLSLEEKEKIIPGISMVKELSPELLRKILVITTNYNNSLNCHGASIYLIGLTKRPIPIPFREISDCLKKMKRNTELLPGSLICYHAGSGTKYVPHSGILLLSKDNKQLIIHKPNLGDPIMIEPVEDAFARGKITEEAGELESYSLK